MAINHVANRDLIVAALRAEIVGPDPNGATIEFSDAKVYDDAPVTQMCASTSGDIEEQPQEILRGEPPNQRYGVGVLYPVGARSVITHEAVDGANPVGDPAIELDEADKAEFNAMRERTVPNSQDDASDDYRAFSLDSANEFQPSSLGLSFLADLSRAHTIRVEASGGRYQSRTATVRQRTRHNQDPDGPEKTFKQLWWFRVPVETATDFLCADVLAHDGALVPCIRHDIRAGGNTVTLEVQLFTRKQHGTPPGARLITAVLINKTPVGQSVADTCLFQTHVKVKFTDENGEPKAVILPYPRIDQEKMDKEEQSLALLYRDSETFAVGHGCAANWDGVHADRHALSLSAECLPTYETASTTPDLVRADGTALRVSMNALSMIDSAAHEGFAELEEVVTEYRTWIKRSRTRLAGLSNEFAVGAEHLDYCETCAARMDEGIAFLRRDDNQNVLVAFALANHAMLLQGSRSRLRRPMMRTNNKVSYANHPKVEGPEETAVRYWRPFQIAFLLMSLRSAVDPTCSERETVELIWFPTGGGKTEAYLGLAAFSMFYRRLRDRQDVGTHVLMRYTLRLLTQQQLQRASSLICAMEYLRSKNLSLLGNARFSIGIWAGGDVTPNKRTDAIGLWNDLIQTGKVTDGNLLVLSNCPWCGAETSAEKGAIHGAVRVQKTIKYVCPDIQCEFSGPDFGRQFLPVEFIDEDIYLSPPSLVVGTVDKFATMHYCPDARSLFGLGRERADSPVVRTHTPPGLIIQDELHLISGPLGSMVGLYEGLVEKLCTDTRSDSAIRPKIVCSTATIRRYREQCRALFGRQDVQLFPPPGLDAGDSFFARYAYNDDGSLQRGRMYVGVHPTGYTSGQTARVRTFSSLLQSPLDLVDGLDPNSPCRQSDCRFLTGPRSCDHSVTNSVCREAQDPWWTMLVFFNSLRDLGNAIALFQSDVPDYRQTVLKRRCAEPRTIRMAYRPRELTSRLRNDEIPAALNALEVKRTDSKRDSVGVCLASNIIEVGIDVDRLSLMCVVAQPKTTATYIQVTGRVGRNWTIAPGLVVTIYAADRARDRSHFERFRSYHERLYAQVEPTSVTPFSEPVLERALHGIYAAFVRLVGTEAEVASPNPFPGDEIVEFVNYMIDRAERCGFAREQTEAIRAVANKRLRKWKYGAPQYWISSVNQQDALLTSPTGNPLEQGARTTMPWATPNSMRNVDASCELAFSQAYIDEEEEIV